MDRKTLTAFSALVSEAEDTVAFLRRLAEHLEASDMPGQAGNCMIRAVALEIAASVVMAEIVHAAEEG